MAYTTCLTVVLIAILFVVAQCASTDDDIRHEIVLINTPIEIEEVLPKGELYVCSSIIEDYVTKQKTERHLGLISEKHSCVQIVRQKCSYKIDLDKVQYVHDEGNVVLVKLPELEYVASTQNTPFMSDEEEYWIEALPSTNGLKQQVMNNIKKRFDTEANRKKATRYAENAISLMLSKLGYQAEFVSKIEQKKE